MKFRKLTLLLFVFFFSKSTFAIEAFKSMGDDLDSGFTYILLILLGYVLPIIAGVIFIVLRHANKNPWYSFGIYIPAIWIVVARYIINFRSEQINGSTEPSGFPFGLLVIIIILVVHILYDYEQVKQNRIKKS